MRLLLLMPKTTYRADDFLAAADKLGVEVVLASDRCHMLEELGEAPTTRPSIGVDFDKPEEAAREIAALGKTSAIDGVIATDDVTAVIATHASAALGLPHNRERSADALKDKWLARDLFASAGVRQAKYRTIAVSSPPSLAAKAAGEDPGFPCVLKPRFLSASRGVMRADSFADCEEKFARLQRMLADPELKAHGGKAAESILVESFIPGAEVALEGLLTNGELEVLALFDKPDPLDGPFFEETLYVQPSRHAAAVQQDVIEQTRLAAQAIGLVEGPIHAELRLGPGGAHVLEVAARSIGGLCSRTLRFGTGMTQEEVLVRHALRRAGLDARHPPARSGASGVLMIPIPRSGVFRGIDGVDEVRALRGIEEVTITALPGRELAALPEGSAYLGFVFARDADAAAVEAVLRAAQARLKVRIASTLARAT